MAAHAARADSLASHPDKVRDLVGTIGEKMAIEMHLTETAIMRRDSRDEVLWLLLLQEGGDAHLSVGDVQRSGDGRRRGQPTIEIEEFVDGKKTGVFVGRFDDRGGYSGTWESWEPERKLRFRLTPKR